MAAAGQRGTQEDDRPSKKEGCLNGAVDLACCFTTAVLVVGGAAGSGLAIRSAKRRLARTRRFP